MSAFFYQIQRSHVHLHCTVCPQLSYQQLNTYCVVCLDHILFTDNYVYFDTIAMATPVPENMWLVLSCRLWPLAREFAGSWTVLPNPELPAVVWRIGVYFRSQLGTETHWKWNTFLILQVNKYYQVGPWIEKSPSQTQGSLALMKLKKNKAKAYDAWSIYFFP